VRRKLFNLATAVSLVLCVAVAGLWAISYTGRIDLYSRFFLGRYDGDRRWLGYYLAGCDGQLSFELEQINYAARPTSKPVNRWSAEEAVGLYTPTMRVLPFEGKWGFHFANWYTPGPFGQLAVLRIGIPCWSLVLTTAPLPLFVLASRLAHRRRDGRCPTCGYDLRATPARCPECGTATASPASDTPPS
jgi:hypothetical protein